MKLISVLLLIALVFSAAAGLAESTSLHASSFMQKLVPKLGITGETAPPSEPASPPTPQPRSKSMGSVGRIGAYTVEIKDAALMKDGEGGDCIVVTFQWSHESDEEQSFLWSFLYDAYQDNAELFGLYIDLPIETELEYFKAGTVQLTQVAYALENAVSPVKIVLSEYLGETEDTIERTFDLAALGKIASVSTPKPAFSPYIGTVEIVKSGYLTAYYGSNTNSGEAFRVHHGERFLCLGETDNGWYEIEYLNGDIAYVSGKNGAVALESYATDGVTFSTCEDDDVFLIVTVKKADVYSQPKSGGQTKRESGGSSSTFYLPAQTELYCFGKTYRQGKEWYVLLLAGHGNSNVPEISWLQADDCLVLEGNPDNNIIPGWWYD